MTKLLKPDLAPILAGNVSFEEAVSASRMALQQPDADPRWCLPLGYVFWSSEQFAEAYQALIPFHTSLQNDGDFLLLFGMVTRQLPDRQVESEAAFLSAIDLQPLRHDAYYNLGNLYMAQEKFDLAIDYYRQSLSLHSNSPLCWLNLGLAARSLDRLQLSKASLQICLMYDPDNARVWCNYGITCHQLERFGQAELAYKQALSLDSEHGPSLVNLALSLNSSNRHPEAVPYLTAASSLKLGDDSGDALFNLALTRLLLGQFVKGWELYECRFKTRQFPDTYSVPAGEWIQTSERLFSLAEQGCELVVWSEQGLGDSIQFVRYLSLLQSLGIKPIFATRPVLVRLFKEWLQPSFPVIDDVAVDIKQDPRPHTSLMSLPHLFSTDLHSVPSVLPYLFPPCPPPKPLLSPVHPGGLSVGIVWASNPDNKLMYRRKSLPLSALLEPLIPAMREDLLQVHSLQVGDDSKQLNSYSGLPGLVDWNGRLGDFADTAHVVSQLDLVISVDTGVAHLAGALGIPTWLLLHYDSDFRWLRNCTDTPWYPGMKLFRQKIYGDWSTVTKAVVDELGRIYGLDLLALQ